MTWAKLVACIALWASTAGAQGTTGVHPRAKPEDYAVAHAGAAGTYAVSIVSADQVKHLFAADISKSYLVFEVACYPGGPNLASLDPDDFLVKVGTTSEFVHPADATTVASVIQQKNTPPPPSNNKTAVTTSAEVGYESGTDPTTGRRVHGVYTAAGAGVGQTDPMPPSPPPPGTMPQDRAVLESQLANKALPQGSFSAPVAGFLYFPAKAITKKTSGNYELDYLGDPAGKVELAIPAKSR